MPVKLDLSNLGLRYMSDWHDDMSVSQLLSDGKIPLV